MMATATVSSAGPRYAPEDPTNPETNVTPYEKPAASSHTGSTPPQKLSSAPVSSSVQVEQSSHGHCDSIFNDDDDRYNGGSNNGSKLDTGTRSYQRMLFLNIIPVIIGKRICKLVSNNADNSHYRKCIEPRHCLRLVAKKMPELLDFDKDLIHLEAA
ncbi:unnamed protein product [Camellia sinensis]